MRRTLYPDPHGRRPLASPCRAHQTRRPYPHHLSPKATQWKQEEYVHQKFCLRVRIPFGTLCDWERGRAEPNQPIGASIVRTARDPEYIHRTLDRQASS